MGDDALVSMPDGSKRTAASIAPVAEDDERLDPEYLREHPAFFREQCIKIKTKKHGLQPFYINYTQRTILETIHKIRQQGRRPQILCLKSRQVGVSTVAAYLLFQSAFLNPFREGLIVADDTEHAKGLFRMIRRFNRFLPEKLRLKHPLNNVREMEFPHDSRIQVEAEGDIHSMTATEMLLTEFAFYKKPGETLSEGMQTLPDSPSSLAIIESTANGQGNVFHEMWCAAVEQSKNPDLPIWERGWTPIFIPWWRHEEYKKAPWFMPDDVTREEHDIMRRFKIGLERIAWRRWCIPNNCKGDPEAFQVQYPATWQEAFLLSGRPIFDPKHLEKYDAMCPPARDAIWITSAPCEIEWDPVQRKPIIVANERGRLRIFKDENPRHLYAIGADPSEGDRKSDPTPIEVLDRMNFEQVAEWWDREPPDLLAKHAAHLGWKYNTAQINAEANNHGIQFFATLLDLKYPNIWFRTTHEESVSAEPTEKPGLFETNKTKHAIFDLGRQMIREGRGAIYSPLLLGEMHQAQYQRKRNRDGLEEGATKITRPPGKFIDACISFLIALYTHRGAEEAPLLPLPELEILSIESRVVRLRERDPAGADQLALDLMGMTGAEFDALLEARYQRKLKAQRTGIGMER
jgi:hypothetical protein